MDDKLKQWYEYLVDVYGISKATVVLAEKMLLDFDDKSNMREMQIILINALYHSAAVNIGRILDHDENGININKFLTAYCSAQSSPITFMVDLATVERLRKRRNKSLVHADKINLDPDMSKKIPFYISDLKSILKSLEDLLFPLATEITGSCVAGKNIKTGEQDFAITRKVETQYDIFQNMLLKYRQMQSFMKENCKE